MRDARALTYPINRTLVGFQLFQLIVNVFVLRSSEPGLDVHLNKRDIFGGPFLFDCMALCYIGESARGSQVVPQYSLYEQQSASLHEGGGLCISALKLQSWSRIEMTYTRSNSSPDNPSNRLSRRCDALALNATLLLQSRQAYRASINLGSVVLA